jgi:uncharacterized protein
MMATLQIPIADVGLEALDAFLSSDRSPPDSMMLSDLDGFLTAIAIGPELVLPGEWMPVIWGGEEPVFADDAEMQAVLGGIMSRYNEILRQIADRTFEPIVWSTADGTLVAADWADGFLQAISLRATAWEPLIRSEDGHLLFPILALCGDENGDSLLDIAPEDEDEILAEAGTVLPVCAIAIADYWKGRGRVPRVHSVSKPGRNEPCSCGSGRKFKRCCGRIS